jgi:ankyrin repeat protein
MEIYADQNESARLSYERRQLASEVPMRKTAGLVEAPPGSPWSKALDSTDCEQLMKLLQENPRRVVQKSVEGFTVVHAAARRGCLKLLDHVFDLFKDKCRFVDKEEGIEVSLQELLKAETNLENAEKARLTAFELAWWSMGDYECRHYLLKGDRQLGTFLSYQSDIFGSSIDSEVDDEESSPVQQLLRGVLADHRSLLSDTMRSEEDVEYNFVADCEELRFHHACENLVYEMDSRRYVEAVIGGCVEKGPHVLKYLFQLRNAQGQTPLHVALKSFSGRHLVPLIPGGESGQENAECLNMRDSRGWTALHFASVQGNLNDLDVLLEDGRADVNAKVTPMSWTDTDYCTFATPLHLAVINNSPEAVKRLWQDPRTDVNALFHRRIYFDDSLYVSRFRDDLIEWTALQLAAVAGLPEVVKVLITCPRVCICLHINPSMTKDTFN